VSTLLELREEIVTVLEAALNVDGEFPVQVAARRLMSPTPPVVDMWPGNAGEIRDPVASGFGDLNGSILITVRARVAAADNEAEQELLYAFCDDEDLRCVAAALMSDQTLNGLASSIEVLGPSEPTIYQDIAGQTPLLGVQWRVEILNVTT
jgi:hypothetical protein